MGLQRTYRITTAKSFARACGHLYTLKRKLAKIDQEEAKQNLENEAAANAKRQPIADEYQALLQAVWEYMLAHLGEIFGARSKIRLPSVTLGRKTTKSTDIISEEVVIKALKEMGADYAVISKEAVSLTVLNAHPELIDSIAKKYPGVIKRHDHLNLRLDFVPRGRKDQLAVLLTHESLQETLDKD